VAFRIHHYFAKERGLMIIGTASDLRLLGQRLVDECRDASETEDIKWPRQVADVAVSNVVGYSVSFHLETHQRSEPKGNGLQSEVVKTVFFVLALVGVISLVFWGARLVL